MSEETKDTIRDYEERIMRTVAPMHQKLRLDQYVAEAFDGFTRADGRKAIENGEIWINGQTCKIQSRSLYKHDRVTWLRLPETPYEVTREILDTFPNADPNFDWRPYGGPPTYLYRDNYVAIINKQSGIPIESTPKEDLNTCLRKVEATLKAEGLMAKRLYVTAAHRLDQGASGVVAFALRKQSAKRLSTQFQERTAKRHYRLLVVGEVKQHKGFVNAPIARTGPGVKRGVLKSPKSKSALSHYEVLERYKDATLLQVRLETGRTHQIRVHMAHIGHPLIGDWLYCDEEHAARCPEAPRLMLHAHTLALTHPNDGRPLVCEAPLDDDFTNYMNALPKP